MRTGWPKGYSAQPVLQASRYPGVPEKTVVQLLDYAVDFAQGYLFGEPRAVRDDSLKAQEQAAPSPVVPFRKAG